MTEIRVNDHTLLLLPDTEVQIEHLNPLFQDGIEDSFSMPVTVPVRGNEITLEHSQELAIAERKTLFSPARLLHNGVPLLNGNLSVLSSNETTIDTSFTVEGLVTDLKDRNLPDLLDGLQIDLLAEVNQLPPADKSAALSTLSSTGTIGIVLADRKRYRAGGDCHFPQHFNEKLYGDTNPSWFKKGRKYEAGATYNINDLVDYTERTPLERTFTWQCTDDGVTTKPPEDLAHWKRVAYGVVNAWDGDTNYFQYNNLVQGNAFALVPWFYVKWVLEKALGSLGYSVHGDFMADRSTDELLLPNSTTLDANAPTNNLFFFHVGHTTEVHYDPGTTVNDRFLVPSNLETVNYQDPDNLWDPSTRTFTCPQNGTWSFRLDIDRGIQYNRSTLHRIFMIDEDDNVRVSALSPPRNQQGPQSDQFNLLVALSLADVGHTFRFAMVEINPLSGQIVWPVNAADRYAIVDILGAMMEERPEICTPAATITPKRHVPNVSVGEWLLALGDVFNFTVVSDSISKTIRLDYREVTAQAQDRYNNDETGRCISPIQLDHQRASAGYTLHFDVPDSIPDTTVFDPNTVRHYTEADLPAPLYLGEFALLLSTRQLLISRYDPILFEFYWQRVGYYVPDVVVGDGSKQISSAATPLAMEQFHVKGHQYLMPVMDEPGTSAFFGDKGESTNLYLCEYMPGTDAAGTLGNVPSARSWGFGWSIDDRSSRSLIWYDSNADLPGLYPHQWKKWLNLMATAEPVRMDLHVDPPFLLNKAWQEPFLLRSQRFIIQRLPLTYPNLPGPLLATDVQALRLRPGVQAPVTLGSPGMDPVVPPEPSTCSGEGYGSFTVAPGGAAAPVLTTSTGHYAIRDADGNVVVDGSLEAGGSYCLYASDASGNMTGEVTELYLFYGELAGMVIDGFTALRVIYMEYWVIPSLPSFANQPLLELAAFSQPPPITTLPDFHPDAVLTGFHFGPILGGADTFPLANVGVLPTFGSVSFINCALTQTAVDAIINHCDPSVPGICDLFGGTSAPRSSASDTNYYACVGGGWTFYLNP